MNRKSDGPKSSLRRHAARILRAALLALPAFVLVAVPDCVDAAQTAVSIGAGKDPNLAA